MNFILKPWFLFIRNVKEVVEKDADFLAVIGSKESACIKITNLFAPVAVQNTGLVHEG